MTSINELRNYPERTILAFLDDPVAVISPRGRVVYVNPAFRGRFRTDSREVTGTSLSGLLPGWMTEPILERLERLEPGGPAHNFWVGQDRERFRVSMGGITLQARVAGAVVMLWDSGREVEVKRQNLELFWAMLEDLAYPIEEVKALLNRPGRKTEAMCRSALSQLEQAGDGMARFRDFGDLFFGQVRVERVPFQPGRLLALARKSLFPLAEQKGVYLEEGSSRELSGRLGDPALLSRVLGLLLDYMIRIVPSGEVVVVSAEHHRSGEISSGLTYSITGTGVVDLDAEWSSPDRPISEGFISVASAKKLLLLRLLLARRLVSAMGGTITVAAHEYAGTTLMVRVPLGAA